MSIETSLARIFALRPARSFLGFGVLVEGPAIITAGRIQGAGGACGMEVEIDFPAIDQTCRAMLPSRRSAVLLVTPARVPHDAMALDLPRTPAAEAGAEAEGFVLTSFGGVLRRIPGRIDPAGAKLVRGFHLADPANLPLPPQAIGAPVFTRSGRFAGIVIPAAAAGNAHVIPATAIRRHVVDAKIGPTAAALRVSQATLRALLEDLPDPPLAGIPDLLRAYVTELRLIVRDVAPPIHDDEDITEIISAARARLAALDAAGARRILSAGIAAQAQSAISRGLPLLRERAEIEQAAGNHEASRITLAEMTKLDPNDFWAWVDLGAAHRSAGAPGAALTAFRSARDAAMREGSRRDIALAYMRIGNVLDETGDLPGALHALRRSVDFTASLVAADPTSVSLRRNLALRHDALAAFLERTGNFSDAVEHYRAGRDIIARLAVEEPDDLRWRRDLVFCNDRVGFALRALGDHRGARTAYDAALRVAKPLAAAHPDDVVVQQDLAMTYFQLGLLLAEIGDAVGARRTFRACLSVNMRLADADPDDAASQREVMLTLQQLAGSDPRGARRHLSRALALALALEATGRLRPDDADLVAEFEGGLAALTPSSCAPETG